VAGRVVEIRLDCVAIGAGRRSNTFKRSPPTEEALLPSNHR
jgi:hypothetical protein